MKLTLPEYPISGIDIEQVVYDNDPKLDKYYIVTTFRLNRETNQVISDCQVYVNYWGKKVEIYSGTYKDCFNCIQDCVQDR